MWVERNMLLPKVGKITDHWKFYTFITSSLSISKQYYLVNPIKEYTILLKLQISDGD